MQKLAKYRVASKVFSWIHFVLAIFDVIGSAVLIVVVSCVLDDPNVFAGLGPYEKAELENEVHFGIVGLFYYIFLLAGSCVDVWIAKGLIDATNVETICEIAIPLAKRWRFWFIILTITYVVLDFIVYPFAFAAIAMIFSLVIKGLICYFVHQYIQSLEQIVARRHALNLLV